MTDFKWAHPHGGILAIDQMSVYWQCSLGRVWSPIGQTPIVGSTPQRHCLKFYGAVKVETGQEMALS